MSAPLHLNLLKEDEIFSSSPIRLRVMLPIFAMLSLAAIAVAWALVEVRFAGLRSQKRALEGEISSSENLHKDILRLRKEKTELAATLQQFAYYTNSCVDWGGVLQAVGPIVPTNIQLTAMSVIPARPPLPPTDKKERALWNGPTNLTEDVSLLIEGRAVGVKRDEAISSLLKSLQSSQFTNRIESASILKGDIRQDPMRRDLLLFKITCRIRPRRFE